MLNDFVNSLPPTAYRRLAAAHRFQIHASQALVSAGQHEQGAAPHRLRYFGPVPPADKLNVPLNTQVAHQRFILGAIRPFSNNTASKLGKGKPEISERSQNKFMAFAAQQVADNQNLQIEWSRLGRIRRK